MMHPIGLDDELLVVHPLPGNRHVGCPGFGVLLEQSLVTGEEHLEHVIVGSQRVQFGPVVEIFERVVRAVIGAPTHEALKVAAVVEVFLEELPACRHVVGQELPLERGPAWRVHVCVDANHRIGILHWERV